MGAWIPDDYLDGLLADSARLGRYREVITGFQKMYEESLPSTPMEAAMKFVLSQFKEVDNETE